MTKLEKNIAQRLEKIRINSSYYGHGLYAFDIYGVKDVNSFYKDCKKKLYLGKRTKFLNQRRKQILDKKSAGSSSRLCTDNTLSYQRD